MNRILFCLCILMLGMGSVSAQMTRAKRIPPAVEKKVVLNAPAQKVWDYISEPANYKKFSGVKSFTCKEKALNAKIGLTTRSGKQRNQYISVIHSDYDGDNQWVYSFDVHPKGEKKCEFVVGVYHGFEALPEGFKTGITQEFNDIITGVSKEFK